VEPLACWRGLSKVIEPRMGGGEAVERGHYHGDGLGSGFAYQRPSGL
jgi:hypothetical protein